MNYEVVRKVVPCAWYADWQTEKCRWCQRLYHVREQHGSRTLCGHPCLTEDDWAPLVDWHPEDVSAIDRCQVCYSRIVKEEVIL